MGKEAEELRQRLEEGLRNQESAETNAIAELFAKHPVEQAAAIVAEACRGLPYAVLGYCIVPQLKPQLQDKEAFRTLLRIAADPDKDEAFRHVLLDAMDRTIRRDAKAHRDEFWQVLRGIATAKEQASAVRAKAIRGLARDDAEASREAVREALAGKDPQAVGAAARVVRHWHRSGKPYPGEAPRLLARFAAEAPRQALASPSILSALAELEGEKSESLRLLAAKAETDLEAARLLGASGAALDDESYGRLVERAANEPAGIAGAILLAQEASGHGRLERLRRSGHRDAERLLVRSPLAAVVPAKQAPLSGLGPSQPQSFAPTSGQSIACSFAAGFHKGDALYRDLLNHPLWDQHWHTAIYLGFDYYPGSGIGKMLLINASTFFGDTIHYFSAERDFGSPDTDVASRMAELKEAFLTAFREGEGEDILYHGARTVPGITPAQRNAVVSTAHSLFGQDISYTFEDMMDYIGWTWEGTLSDIDETRCDGVVEYSYERNGLRVCSGANGDLWNISAAGADHMENHNDFHNGSYDPGELCPRIQAGNYGHGVDSNFVVSEVSPPQVAQMLITQEAAVPAIQFRVDAPAYTGVMVRLTVSKDGGPFFFVRSERPAPNAWPGNEGDWAFKYVASAEAQTAYWRGKTVNGPDFGGQNGRYVFRLVAADLGGNVSELFEAAVNVAWTSAIKIDTICYDPPWLDQYGEYVVIRNEGVAAQVMTGWKLRDLANHVFTFPAFTLPGGDAVKVWTGTGIPDAHNLYWGRSQAVWNNTGDTAMLFDASGNLIHQYSYMPTHTIKP